MTVHLILSNKRQIFQLVYWKSMSQRREIVKKFARRRLETASCGVDDCAAVWVAGIASSAVVTHSMQCARHGRALLDVTRLMGTSPTRQRSGDGRTDGPTVRLAIPSDLTRLLYNLWTELQLVPSTGTSCEKLTLLMTALLLAFLSSWRFRNPLMYWLLLKHYLQEQRKCVIAEAEDRHASLTRTAQCAVHSTQYTCCTLNWHTHMSEKYKVN